MNMPDATKKVGGQPRESMTSHANDDDLMNVLKDIYKTADASPGFKEKLHHRLTVEAGMKSSTAPKSFWRQPYVCIPAAAGAAVALVLVIVFVIVPAVSRNDVVIPPGPIGTLEVRVTDAKNEPAVTAIDMTFDNISVHRAGVEGDSDGEWITVAENLGRTVDLLQLSGVGELLGQDDIEAGHYTQIRVGVVKVVVTIDGSSEDVALEPTGDATIPSGELKFVQGFEVEDGETTVITIDFDISADKSLVFAGGKWLFKPTIKLDVTSSSE
jgi:hypothetical protein